MAIEDAVAAFQRAAGDLASWSRLDALIRSSSGARRISASPPTTSTIAASSISTISPASASRSPRSSTKSHKLVFRLLEDGVLDGLRLDHIDGLLDPKAYCLRLREKAPRPSTSSSRKSSLRTRALRDGLGGRRHDRLRVRQPPHRLLIDPGGEEALTADLCDFTGETRPFEDIVRDFKLRIMENEMASELNVLAREAARAGALASPDRRLHQQCAAPSAEGDHRLLSRLPDLCRRRAAPRMPIAATSTGRSPRRDAMRPRSTRASSISCTSC